MRPPSGALMPPIACKVRLFPEPQAPALQRAAQPPLAPEGHEQGDACHRRGQHHGQVQEGIEDGAAGESIAGQQVGGRRPPGGGGGAAGPARDGGVVPGGGGGGEGGGGGGEEEEGGGARRGGGGPRRRRD